MKPQPHTWMEYQYKITGENDNNKMWMRDDQTIYQLTNGSYVTATAGQWCGDVYNTFQEAQNFLDQAANDESLCSSMVEQCIGNAQTTDRNRSEAP